MFSFPKGNLGSWWRVKHLTVFSSFCLPGSVLSWPKRRSRDVTSVRLWCPGSPKWFWARTRPSPTTMSSTWTPSRKPSTISARRNSSKAALRATMPLSLHTDRLEKHPSLLRYSTVAQKCSQIHIHWRFDFPSLRGMELLPISQDLLQHVIWGWFHWIS